MRFVDVKKFLRIVGVSFLALLAIGAVVLFFLYRASQREPQFYQEALALEPEEQAEAGDELEKSVLDLRNEVREEGRWEAVFTNEQINGWLAADLPTKFPNTLPKGVSDPRISISKDLAQIACRYQSRRFSSVVSIGLTVQMAEDPNVVALRLRYIRAGALPLPTVEKWKEKFEQAATDAGVPLRWETIDGDDVALVKLNPQHKDFVGKRLVLETIELRDGEIWLAGRTEPESSTATPVFNTANSQSAIKFSVQR